MRLFEGLHTNHRQIAQGMLLVSVLILGSKIISAVKEVAVAWRYGISGDIDAYLLALTVATWLPVLLSSLSLVIFVPRLADLRGDNRHQFISQLNTLYLMLAAAVWALTGLLGPTIVGWIAGGLADTTVALARQTIVTLSPISGFIVITGYLALRLQSMRKFGYTFFEAMPAIFILAFLFLMVGEMSIAPIVWGVVVGFGVQVLILAGLTRGTEGSLGAFTLPDFGLATWQGVGGAVGIMSISYLIGGLNTPIDQIFAARVGDYAIATLGYSDRINALATALGATAIARATLPVFSAAVKSEPLSVARNHAVVWAAIMLGIGTFAAAIGWLFSTVGVRLLFERGAFHAQDTELVSSVFRYSVFQLPFYFAFVVVVQWLAATKQLKFVLIATTCGVSAKLASVMLLSDWGIYAIPSSTVIFYTVALVVGSGLLFRGLEFGRAPE